MPDGSLAPTIAASARQSRRDRMPVGGTVPLVGNPTGPLYRLTQIDAELTAMEQPSREGRNGFKGRGLQREANALVNLAVTQKPANMTDCVAIIAAAYEKVSDVHREERTANEMSELLEAPIVALESVARFLAVELGLRAEDFGGDWIFMGEDA